MCMMRVTANDIGRVEIGIPILLKHVPLLLSSSLPGISIIRRINPSVLRRRAPTQVENSAIDLDVSGF